MRRIIMIGECALDIIFPTTQNNYPLAQLGSLKAQPGGRLLNAAALLATMHPSVTYVSEAARDRIGDMIVSFLEANKVNTASIDRFVDGDTPSNLFFPVNDTHPVESIMSYRRYPDDSFDVVWPDVGQDDIVVFGNYFALDPRVRPQLVDLLRHCIDQKAIIIYVPGFLEQQVGRITRVMPSILENMEMADLIVSRTRDLVHIYNSTDEERTYQDHIRFYCSPYINIDPATRKMTFHDGNRKVETPISRPPISLMWHAGALAGLVSSIIDLGITRSMLAELPAETMSELISEANSMADTAVDRATLDHY